MRSRFQLKEMESLVRGIQMDGLNWGASKLVPVGYGIQKLQILCTIEDEKVSVDVDLVERIQEEFEDHVSGGMWCVGNNRHSLTIPLNSGPKRGHRGIQQDLGGEMSLIGLEQNYC